MSATQVTVLVPGDDGCQSCGRTFHTGDTCYVYTGTAPVEFPEMLLLCSPCESLTGVPVCNVCDDPMWSCERCGAWSCPTTDTCIECEYADEDDEDLG